MSLTNRLSILLLVILGLTLSGFSTAFFVSSRIYLNGQVDERLALILTLLNSSADTKRGWVRWDAREKRLPPNRFNENSGSTWLVFDAGGRVLTRPSVLREGDLPDSWVSRVGLPGITDRVKDDRGRSWKLARRQIVADPDRALDSDRPTDTSEGKSYHREIQLIAFASVAETESTLRTLGWSLFGISLIILALAALCSRWLSRKALVPLTRLVESAQALDATKHGWMLAEVGTRDELDMLRRVFNDLLTRLHDAYDRQRQFSSEASHQLRTPVATLIGHLEVAQRYERSVEDYRRVIRMAHKRSVALGQTVESLLFLSRADSATLTGSEPLDFGRSLLEHLESRPQDDRSGDIRLHLSSPDRLWIKAQPQLLAQLIENLLDNACKYSRAGTPIVFTLASADSSALLSIDDSGRGISSEDLPRIFEPFFRSATAASDRIPGVGLGLSVVQRVAQAFGGTVAVRSEIGRGSCFKVRFPLTRPPEAEIFEEPGGSQLAST